jgi:hypothetical protein
LTLSRHRLTVALVLAAALAWLLYVVVAAQRKAPEFLSLLTGLGNPLPTVSRSFFLSYPWWWLVPVLFALLAIDVARRPEPRPRYFALVLGAILLSAFALQAWMLEAVSQPLNTILEAIG